MTMCVFVDVCECFKSRFKESHSGDLVKFNFNKKSDKRTNKRIERIPFQEKLL